MTDSVRNTAAEVVPWFVESMPQTYFQDTSHEDQLSHLRALLAAIASGNPPELVLKNEDVPGVIGRVGTILGSHEINIAEYHQARLTRGGDALATVAVDGVVGDGVREALLELPEVSRAVVVALGSSTGA